ARLSRPLQAAGGWPGSPGPTTSAIRLIARGRGRRASVSEPLDPLGALAMFLALLGDATHEQRRRGARLAALTVFGTLILAMLVGRQLLTVLGISMGAFRVAGGTIILLTGLKMLGGQLGQDRGAGKGPAKMPPRPELQAIVPLGTPLIA